MNAAYWLNSAWSWYCRRELECFHRATASVAQTQAQILRGIVSQNRSCAFGAAHGFGGIDTAAEFQESVPLSTYDDYQVWIDRLAAGESAVLTRDPVRLFEPTSGTTGADKLIPYTAALRAQFQRAIRAWIADLMLGYPAIRHGRAFWSISPALGARRTKAGGISIGFDDDRAYLGKLESFALGYLLAVPASVARLTDLQNFRYCTLLYLLAAKDLALISIWSPTFLLTLLDQLPIWGERLCRDMRDEILRLPNDASAKLAGGRIKGLRRRGAKVSAILESGKSPSEKLRQLWPRLVLISCWADGAASQYLPALRQRFPQVAIQAKGLLATEGFISFPLVGQTGGALAVRSHFFEFLEVGGRGNDRLHLAHELERGGQYEVVITTGGGLYRYRLGDRIEVVGFIEQCPLIRFIGRGAAHSDLVGEKLHEAPVREVLERAYETHHLEPQFSMLVPVHQLHLGAPGYRLYLQVSRGALTAHALEKLAATIEAGLQRNPYYKHAVEFGQLCKLEIRIMAAEGEAAWSVYERACLERGQTLGNIKPSAFHNWTGWAQYFDPLTVGRQTN